ncbi:hypothetical protein J6590_065915 [Homalodisca vitripennis]|nr:hypothetical protein J6590_065915 [Homalodisca vitripennis]
MEAERVFSACTDYAPVPAGLFESLSTQGVLTGGGRMSPATPIVSSIKYGSRRPVT